MEVKGLTTATSIWLSAALGTVAGLKHFPLAAAGTVVSLLVLAMLRPLEKGFNERLDSEAEASSDHK